MSDLATQLAGKRIVVCAGAGGVGKTTVAAAVGLGLAARGARVAVITIDPARRLAEALGIAELGNRPQAVPAERFQAAGLNIRGDLLAMMLDVKGTFDELIERLAPSAQSAHAILENRVYRHLSTAVAGSQEYTAVAKLYELAVADDYDVIVLDTPPSRNAVDFLDAPDRLIGFLDAGTAGAFARPAGAAIRAAGFVVAALGRIAGTGLLEDLRTFFGLMSGLLEGFHVRAVAVQELLRDPATGFILVSSPEREAVDEAIVFARELERWGMHRCAAIVNRVQPLDRADAGVTATTARLVPSLGPRLAATVARTHEQVQILARRDQNALTRLREQLRMKPVCATDRDADVHDAIGLVGLHDELFGFGKVRNATGASPT